MTLASEARGGCATSRAGLLRGMLLCFLAGFMVVRYATVNGIGTQPDSAAYLSVAENLVAGNGLLDYTGRPLYQYPPGYSAALAASHALTGLDVRYGGPRLVGCIVFGLLAALCFLFGTRVCDDTDCGWLCALAVLSSSSLAAASVHAQSEGLFLVLTMGGLVCIWRHAETCGVGWLFASAFLFGASALVRYAGLFWVPAGAAVALLLPRALGAWRRMANAAGFVAVSLFGWAAWSVWARVSAGSSNGLVPVFHPVPLSEIVSACAVMASWLAPDAAAALAACWLPVLLGAAAIALWPAFRSRGFLPPLERRTSVSPGLCVLLVFSLAYLSLIVLSISVVNRATPLDSRTLCPVELVWVLMLVVVCRTLLVRLNRSGVLWRVGGVVAILALLGVRCMGDMLPRLAAWHEKGIWLAEAAFVDHPVWRAVRRIPPDRVIHSNTPWSVYLAARHSARLLPMKSDYTSGAPNGNYDHEVDRVVREVREGRATLVYWFRDPPDPLVSTPTLVELRERGLREPVFSSPEAQVFGELSAGVEDAQASVGK